MQVYEGDNMAAILFCKMKEKLLVYDELQILFRVVLSFANSWSYCCRL